MKKFNIVKAVKARFGKKNHDHNQRHAFHKRHESRQDLIDRAEFWKGLYYDHIAKEAK